MIKYKLCAHKSGKNIHELEWNKINPNVNNINSLFNIDNFTVMFHDEQELKQALILKGVMPVEEDSYNLSILYNYQKEIKKTRYGILYKGDKEFLNISFINLYLQSKANDLLFLETLANHYRSSYIQGSNLTFIKTYINKYRQRTLFEKDINYLKEVLNDFLVREVYAYDNHKHTYKLDASGYKKIKYKNLHDLASFLAYQNCKDKQLEENNYKFQTSEKTKKKEINGQINFADMGWK